MSRRSGSWLRCCLVIFAVISALCVCGPALYFKFKLKGVSASACSPCTCHCAPPQSLLKIAPGLANLSVTDCGKNEGDLKEEMEKQLVELLSEEIKLVKDVGEEHSKYRKMSLGEARRAGTQYQREADKCIAAIQTCEGSRERAQSLLTKEKRLTLLWERRAKLLGWEQ